jgi:hypothetical protein
MNDEWPHGFEGHERAQRRRMATWSLEEKVAWLEEMHLMLLRENSLPAQTASHDREHSQD